MMKVGKALESILRQQEFYSTCNIIPTSNDRALELTFMGLKNSSKPSAGLYDAREVARQVMLVCPSLYGPTTDFSIEMLH